MPKIWACRCLNKDPAYFRYAGSPLSITYYSTPKGNGGTGLIALPNSNKCNDWVIRRLFLKPLCKAMEYVPTTTRKVRDTISNRR